MKHPAEPHPKPDTLPSFFDAAEPAAADHEEPETGEPAAEAIGADEPSATATFETSDDAGASGAETPSPSQRTERTDNGGHRPAGGGMPLLVLGLLVVATATALGTMLSESNAVTALARLGLSSGTLFVLGTVLVTGALLQRHLTRLQAPRQGADQGGEWARSAQESLEFLVAAQQASNERPPAAGEELQHVLMAMQRQEEKINNLTKAIKMYGKPLMEISGQTTDLAAAITQTRTAVETAAEAARGGLAKLEARLAGDDGGKQDRAELRDALHVIAADVDKLARKQVTVSLEPVQQHLGRIEVAVAALAQRLDHSDVQKSLLRLEDATQKTREEVHQLRGDGLGKATSQLQDRLDKATRGLTEGLQQLRDGNLGGLESGVRDLQRELSGVATAVAQIQAAVRNGARGAAAAPVAAAAQAAAPAPAAAAAAASTPKAETPAAPSAPAPAAAATKGEDANAGYKTGSRATSGKNVLGAIAKLKQMKN
ncbi:MAG: hypothetical protein JNL08_09345 [Planctomycetes bacterium]|nr:hypothetical protein [Planctomycetota bacterium]